MKWRFKKANGALFWAAMGMFLFLSGCLGAGGRKPAEKLPLASSEKIVHIISVSPYPEQEKDFAQQVDIAYQDPETQAFEFFRERRRPCEFHTGEANLVMEKGERTLILPNAVCPK